MSGHETTEPGDVDIKFVPWPYRNKELRSLVLVLLSPFGLMGVVAIFAAICSAILSICRRVAAAQVLDSLPEFGGLPKIVTLFVVLLIVGVLLVGVWIIAFLRFYRHRANAFVRVKIKENNTKIWISYQRGLMGDHLATNKCWGEGPFGFLLEPERGNSINEGQRHPNAIGAVTNLLEHIEYARFGSRGFRIAYSADPIDDSKTHTLPRPKLGDKDLNLFLGDVELVALNCQKKRPLVLGELFWDWILPPNRYVLYFPKQGRLRSHRLTPSVSNEVGGITERGPLHQLLEELLLMSRYTGTGIKVDKSASTDHHHDGASDVHALLQYAAASIWNAVRQRPNQDLNDPGDGEAKTIRGPQVASE